MDWIEVWPMISVGAIYRGPELEESLICKLISDASVELRRLRDPSYEMKAPWVNPVFIVAGSLGEPDFSGTEYGHYSKKQRGIVVQIAVPAEVAASDDPLPFVIEALHGANAMAFDFFSAEGGGVPSERG